MKIMPNIKLENTKEAIEYYKKVFDVKVIEFTPCEKCFGEKIGLPADFDYENSCMHAEIELEGCRIHMWDYPLDYSPINTRALTLQFDDEDIDEVYKKAVENGFKPIMELAVQFWNAKYAIIEDKYKIQWHLNKDLN